jgi:hypothetical protein
MAHVVQKEMQRMERNSGNSQNRQSQNYSGRQSNRDYGSNQGGNFRGTSLYDAFQKIDEGYNELREILGVDYYGGYSQGRGNSNTSSRRGNYSGGNGQGGNQGRQNYADSDDADDGRTMAGRQAHDAEEYTEEQLQEFINSAPRNQDESIDLRTKEGRALQAAGWVDDEGFELQQTGGNRGSRNRGRSNR